MGDGCSGQVDCREECPLPRDLSATLHRVQGPMRRFEYLFDTVDGVRNTEEAHEVGIEIVYFLISKRVQVVRKYDKIYRTVEEYKCEAMQSWTSRIDREIRIKLDDPVLRIRPGQANLFEVNFDRALLALLREVCRYYIHCDI